jgi:membrane-anchored glycerophosphoryl diester phosphodiesterase (GDPDase)
MLTALPQVVDTQLLETLVSSDLVQMLLKVLFVLAGALYVIFSFVVIRQIALMRQTVVTPSATVIKLGGYVHFLLAFAVLIYFLLFL